ncbi:MAG: hypothetical protein KAQ85_09095, partial [Thermodesulfovibrionia bacterium]|nr:hypothetical protein [Thermodesulfovibrionia bacterium]
MNKRVIYSAFNDKRWFIVNYLKEKHDWNPVFIYAVEQSRKWAKEHYPDVIFQEEMALRNSVFDYSKIGRPVPVDANIIHSLSKFELSCLNLLEDTTGWNFSFYERYRYYYDLLKYWNTVIHRLKPNLYLNITFPHTISDYTLYLLCKYYYNIPILFVSPAPLLEGHYHVVCNSMEDQSSPYQGFYESGQKFDLKPEIKEYLDSLRRKEGKSPEYIQKEYKESKKYQNFQYKDFIKHILMILFGRAFKSSNMAFKCNQRPFESAQSRLNRFQYFWFKDRLRRSNRKLLEIYSSLSAEPDINRKFVYFAAPYQPEASTCPSAGCYEDIFLILDLLSSSIPEDWVIYFKEHPGIFLGNSKGSLSRNRYIYEKVNSYKNVVMIPIAIDSFTLIDHCQAVATPAGTVGWEAAVRGKPALFFGDVWYQGCKSLFRIRTLEDCQEAVRKIM